MLMLTRMQQSDIQKMYFILMENAYSGIYTLLIFFKKKNLQTITFSTKSNPEKCISVILALLGEKRKFSKRYTLGVPRII